MRESVRPRNARAPCASSFLKPTKSSAISTASRSLDAPSDARASSRSRGSSQKALRTFPTLVARVRDVVTSVRDARTRVEERPRRRDVGICPPRRTQQNIISYVHIALRRAASIAPAVTRLRSSSCGGQARYSARSAFIGASAAARAAGTIEAMNAADTSDIAATPSAAGSQNDTPYSCADRR
jgi:hypothetical protein